MVRARSTQPFASFDSATAAKVSGISVPMLNYLCRTGLVEPSLTRRRGHGVRRAYSFADLLALRLIGKLTAAGVSVLRLRKALTGLRRLNPQITLTSLPATHVLTDGRDLYLRQGTDSLERALDGQLTFAFVIELSQLQREIVARADAYTPARAKKTA